jgi:hypothetical protein
MWRKCTEAEVGELLVEAETDLGWAARQEGRLSKRKISVGVKTIGDFYDAAQSMR